MLVFLMSGVMCLFSNSVVFAQNNARREFNFHQENIRTKKRNNDLQKASRAKGRSNQKNGNKIRFRFISGETNKDKLKGKVGKEYNKINSLNIFYNSIGIGFTNYKNEGCKGNADSGEYTFCENTLTEKPYQIGEVNVISILYNFGNNLFFTVGGDLYASGYLITLDGESGNETVMKNPKPLLLFPTTLQFGLKFSKLELLVEYRDSFIEFKRPDSGHDTIETSGTILFGLGLIF